MCLGVTEDCACGPGYSMSNTRHYCYRHGLECKSSQSGKEYGSALNETISGKPCQRWDSAIPHPHEWTRRLRWHANYCRNPDSHARKLGPWCFTTDPNIEWEYCNVSFCVGRAVSDRCSLFKGDSSCGPNMNCLIGWFHHCECSEFSVLEPENKTCLAMRRHRESCIPDRLPPCLPALTCTSNVCICPSPVTQYFDPGDYQCKTIGRYMEPCSLTAWNISCYPPLLCSASECFCEVPALQHYDPANNTCVSSRYVKDLRERTYGYDVAVHMYALKKLNDHLCC
ncbi:HGF [Mytilus coruscus]|uniref:HGF n=1 Tax=Mytilus coruscus TaxID=42192 RepID=A0A6J8ADS1_MYTCO|nr:HGF [Mytilus coruscus]